MRTPIVVEIRRHGTHAGELPGTITPPVEQVRLLERLGVEQPVPSAR